MSLVEVKDLSISFGEREVVHAISLSIDPGQRVGVVGGKADRAKASPLCRLLTCCPKAQKQAAKLCAMCQLARACAASILAWCFKNP